jgi:hypothetical protein
MNSHELDRHQWTKQTNPSGEVVRTKTYSRILPAWDNLPVRTIMAQRNQLAKLLGINAEDMYADLEVTVKISRYPHNRKFLKYNKLNTYYREERARIKNKDKASITKILANHFKD